VSVRLHALLQATTGSAFFATLQALSALLLVLVVVWYTRRALLGGGLIGKRGERMKLEERLGLDLRNALVIVRVEERRLLLALSDRGPARLIAELAAEAVPPRSGSTDELVSSRRAHTEGPRASITDGQSTHAAESSRS
jgi:flagellar biogenesis protein FliO